MNKYSTATWRSRVITAVISAAAGLTLGYLAHGLFR